MGTENSVLFGLGQPRKKRENLCVRVAHLPLQVLSQMIRRFSNLSLTSQEHQHVAALHGVAPQLIQGVCNRFVQAVIFCLFKGGVAQLHRKGSPRDLDDRRGSFAGGKMLGKAVRVDGGRGDNHLQVGAPG